MKTQLALLRAVNVGGRGKVAMSDLRACLDAAGFAEVQTVLQSGNLVLSTDGPGGSKLEAELESLVRAHLGLKTDVMVRSAREWAEMIALNPFVKEAEWDPSHLLAVVTKRKVIAAAVRTLQTAVKATGGRERANEVDGQIYLTFPDGIGRSKVTTRLIEKALGVGVTARNWNTVLKLAELAAKQRR